MLSLDDPGFDSTFYNTIRTHSFATVKLPEELCVLLCKYWQETEEFFDARTAANIETDLDLNEGARYEGCKRIPGVKDILFVKRIHDPNSAVVVSPHLPELPMYDESCRSVFDAMHAVAVRCLRAISFGTKIPWEAFVALLDRPDCEKSCSILSTFRYWPQTSVTPCGRHTDYTLLTLVPVARQPGLEVQDLATFDFVDPEVMFPPTSDREFGVVVFVGETLERFTNNHLTACMHGVRSTFERPRVSCPMLLHGRDDAVMDTASLPQEVIGATVRSCLTAVTVKAFREASEAQKVSVNYD